MPKILFPGDLQVCQNGAYFRENLQKKFGNIQKNSPRAGVISAILNPLPWDFRVGQSRIR